LLETCLRLYLSRVSVARLFAVPISTKERLVAAAHQVATRSEEVSVESAATEAGVSRATAYRTFGGVQQLLDALVQSRGDHHLRAIQGKLSGDEAALDKLETVIAYTVEILQSDATLRDILPHVGLAGHATARPIAFAAVRSLITDGQRDGSIRDDLDIGVITDWLLDAYIGGIEYRKMDETEARAMFRTFYVPALRPQQTGDVAAVNVAVARHLTAALDLLSAEPRGLSR
jgi:AcrR family transcriptional regulator